MAVPSNVTLKNLSGVYTLNKTLSDSSQNMLYMQNVGWLVRQAVAWSNVEITQKQYTDDEGKMRIDTIQLSTGGQRNDEHWIIDGEVRDKESRIWGELKGSFEFIKVDDAADEYLKEGWEKAIVDDEILLCKQESRTDTWKVEQLVGFAEVDGLRRHVRRIVCTKGDQVEKIQMVYDWKSEVPEGEPVEPEGEAPSQSLPEGAAPAM